MPSQFFGLTIGYSGLTAYQAAENTVANNIANVKTKGYSRQYVNQESANALRTYTTYGMAGAGTVAKSIDQLRNTYFDLKYWANNADVGRYTTQQTYTGEIEQYFKESATIRGFESVYSEDFYNALSELEKNPGNETYRTAFVGAAQTLTEYFNSNAANLKAEQESLNSEIKTQVERINAIAEQIASLNKQINIIEINGPVANELRDKRNLLVDELSQIVDVEITESDIYNEGDKTHTPTGAKYYKLTVSNGCMLVDGYDYYSLECKGRKNLYNQSDAEGLYDIYWKHTGMEYSPLASNLSGSLKALIELRDGNNKEALTGTAGSVLAPDTGFEGEAGNDYADLTYRYPGSIVYDPFVVDPATPGQLVINGKTYSFDKITRSGGWSDSEGNVYMKYHFENLTPPLESTVNPSDHVTVTQGSAPPTSAGHKGDHDFSMVRTEEPGTTLTDILSTLDIPKEGCVTIGGTQYYYSGFEVDLIDNTSPLTSKYTFKNLQYIDSIGQLQDGLMEDVNEGEGVYVGRNLDYQGIPYYQSQMNEWIRKFAEVFNSIEKFGGDADPATNGYDLNGDQMNSSFFQWEDIQNIQHDFDDLDPATAASAPKVYKSDNTDGSGNSYVSFYNLTASNFGVNRDIIKDVTKFSTTASEQSNIDLSNASLVFKLESVKDDKSVMSFRGASSAGFLERILSDISLNSANAKSFTGNATNIANVISNQRLSVSGVDEDEEALDLVKFQNAYNLNSKVIQTMTEIYDRLILQTGV